MVHRLALIIGGVGAAAVVSLAVVLGGFTSVVTGSADVIATDALVDDFALPSGTDSSSDKVEAVVDTIFVEASPEPTASPSTDDKNEPSADGNGAPSADRYVDDDDSDQRDRDDDDEEDHDDGEDDAHDDGEDGDHGDDDSGHRGGDRDDD